MQRLHRLDDGGGILLAFVFVDDQGDDGKLGILVVLFLVLCFDEPLVIETFKAKVCEYFLGVGAVIRSKDAVRHDLLRSTQR